MRTHSLRLFIALAAAVICLSMTAAASAADAPVLAAHHAGIITASSIRWRSEYVFHATSERIALAYPLPVGAVVEASSELEPVERGGRIVALRLAPEAVLHGRVELIVTEPLDRSGSAARIAPPLADGSALQIVDVTGGDDLRFAPESRTMIERQIGFFAPAEVAPSARDACDRAMGYARSRSTDDPIYVRASSVLIADEGIRGTLSSGSDRLRTGAIGASALFAAIVLALAIVHRWLSKAAQMERVEQVLAAEFAKIDGDEARGPAAHG